MQASFCHTAKSDMAAIPVKKPCCRRSLAYGLLYAATVENGEVGVNFLHEAVSELFSTLVKEVFNSDSRQSTATVVGRKTWHHSFASKRAVNYLEALNSDGGMTVSQAAVLKCGGCQQAFLRGVFLALGTMSDPTKTFHVELLLADRGRAEKLDEFLALCGIPARRIERDKRVGLYYKNSTAIEEFFTEAGANALVFDLINIKIEKNIRNQENRATNCVAKNISRSVDAISRQVRAIEKLKERGMLDGLPDDLRATAELRLKLDEASLSELASAHTPPISKSGLNHRLERLVELAEKIK